MTKRKLTKEQRDYFKAIHIDPELLMALEDLDAADEEIAELKKHLEDVTAKAMDVLDTVELWTETEDKLFRAVLPFRKWKSVGKDLVDDRED